MRLCDAMRSDIRRLYARMDHAYEQVAHAAGFICRGCDHNCCATLFYHHTLIELLYLRDGLVDLPDAVQADIRRRATAATKSPANDGSGTFGVVICPLNEQGQCRLYTHRPMICRLHGIPHHLRRPDGQSHAGPGCDAFHRRSPAAPVVSLDRTPLYAAMARLEQGLRKRIGFRDRIKMTIAQMVIADLEGLGAGKACGSGLTTQRTVDEIS